MKLHLVIAMSALCATEVSAQTIPAPISTDRPDFTESSTLVPAGWGQLEAGITLTATGRKSGDGTSLSWPELLLRYGVTSRLELRVAQSLATISPPTALGSPYTGLTDLYLGVKLGLGAQRGVRPELALMAQATVPIGDARLSGLVVLPGMALLAGWGLSPLWSLGAGIQVNQVPDNAYEIAPSVTVGRSLSSRVKGYFEVYPFIPVAAGTNAEAAYFTNAGLSWLLTNNVQLDARFGVGLNAAADRSFVGIGFAIRR